LEYEGCARTTNLDEIAGLYHGGPDEFFAAWTEFTDTPNSPQLINSPHVVLIAADFDDRTESALGFLTESGLPVTVLRVTLYEDGHGRRFLDIGADHELPSPNVEVPDSARRTPARFEVNGRRIELSDLIDAGLLSVGEVLRWHRPRLNHTYEAHVTENGSVRLPDGRTFSSPSRAAQEAAEVPACDGWVAWRVASGQRLADLRASLIDSSRGTDGSEA
jgi:hypothetical protein